MSTAVAVRVFSCGAGVQSTAITLLVRDGILERPDHVAFADTGWEPARVYTQLDRIEAVFTALEVPVHRVTAGNLRQDASDPRRRFAAIPFHVRNLDGSPGMGRRECSARYKVEPFTRKVRELLGAAPPRYRRVPAGAVAQQWIGFSTDEIGRVSRPRMRYLTARYPLLELGMSRRDCVRYLTDAGWGGTVRSACIGCPYHGNAAWRALRDTCVCGHHRDHHADRPAGAPAGAPDRGTGRGGRCAPPDALAWCGCGGFFAPEWDDAVAFDAALRAGPAPSAGAGEDGRLRGEAFLHRSLLPLAIAPIDHWTRGDVAAATARVQGDLFDQRPDPDGCSPFGCRSGHPTT